jgi:L-lactate dehydrogenase complex protein LldF
VEALRNVEVRRATRTAANLFTVLRTRGTEGLPLAAMKEQASGIRQRSLDNLSRYVDEFVRKATDMGAMVHRASSASTARECVLSILQDRRSTLAVKSKSMITEEIQLNPYLEQSGIDIVETDLGEYIIQLAGERPSHILAPSIHKNRKAVGELFESKLGVDFSDDPKTLTRVARRVLREKFLNAQAGITGANFAVSETGSLILVTNEGNGRMVTTLPRLHIAVLSIEKIVPSMAEAADLLLLLPRSATGQIMSSYVSIITGIRKPGQQTGAEELHIVLLDNGRSGILKGEHREILKCIRCSACLNVCPVYRTVGGHAYGSTYPGPIGIVLTVLLEGMGKVHPLLDACTLCGACSEVCPVQTPLVRIIRRLRETRSEMGLTPSLERFAIELHGMAAEFPGVFSACRSVFQHLFPTLTKVIPNELLKRIPKPVVRKQ